MERFPDLIVSNHLFEIDRDRFTCSGGVSPLDLMIRLLSGPPGSRELAEQVVDLLVSQRRSHDENQTIPLRHRLGQVPRPLVEALELMECNFEEPLSPAEIANYLSLSRRTLERLFHKTLGESPGPAYMKLRLARARTAIQRTGLDLETVARSNGFASISHFVQRYREAFGDTPMADRALWAAGASAGSTPP